MGVPDRMNRRQIQNVKAHRGDIGKQPLAVLKSPVRAGLGGARPRKHLIPSAAARFLAVDHHGEFLGISGFGVSIGIASDQSQQIIADRRGELV